MSCQGRTTSFKLEDSAVPHFGCKPCRRVYELEGDFMLPCVNPKHVAEVLMFLDNASEVSRPAPRLVPRTA